MTATLFDELPVEIQAPGRMSVDAIVKPVAPAAVRTTLLNIDVGGRSRPKGSMRHIGNGRMIEQLKHSPAWRRAVAVEAHEEVAGCTDRLCAKPKKGVICPKLHAGYPSLFGAEVEIELRFAPLKSVPLVLRLLTILATSRALGDIDKHCRNILDALVDARVLVDDSQVIRLVASKRYCQDGETPGALITVTRVGDIQGGRPVAAC